MKYKRQIHPDVEVGTFLSVMYRLIINNSSKAKELSSCSVGTFCNGNENQSYDESNYARKVSIFFVTDHEVIILNEKIMIDKLPSIINELNEPLVK